MVNFKTQLHFTKLSSFDACSEYGKAKCTIYDAFKWIVEKKLLLGQLVLKSNNISVLIQYNIKNGTIVNDLIIRVQIPCNNNNNTIITIHDLNKPKVNGNYDIMTTPNGELLLYSTFNNIIKPGWICSGIDDMSSFCVSSYEISLLSKCTLLLVKLSDGFRLNASDIFSDEHYGLKCIYY